MLKVIGKLVRGAVGVGALAAAGYVAKEGSLATAPVDLQNVAAVASAVGIAHAALAHAWSWAHAEYASLKARIVALEKLAAAAK